jgi:hypothetical protein
LSYGRSPGPHTATIPKNNHALQTHWSNSGANHRDAEGPGLPKGVFMRYARWISLVAVLSAAGLSGCNESQLAQNQTQNQVNTRTVPSGTAVEVTLGTSLSSETAHTGTAWSGTVLNPAAGIPAGSAVDGTVTAVKAAKKGDRAMLDLGVNGITVSGHRYAVHAGSESIVAGSTRARNLGAIAGSAAAGALIGTAVDHSTEGAVVGAVVGGGVATGVVAASDGYQVLLKPGIALTFTTSEAMAVRQ